MAANTGHGIMRAYAAVLSQDSEYANRTSYVIAPDDTIIYTYTNLNPEQHVANTLAALKHWESEHKQ